MNYSFASRKISATVVPSASAIRNKFKAVTFRSPRSIFPIWERSIPAWCASPSCETSKARRARRMELPKARSFRRSSSVRGLLDTNAPSQEVHSQATGYTTHNFVDAKSVVTHDDNSKEKKMRLSIPLLLVAALSSFPVDAQTRTQIEKRYSADYNQCIDASGGVTSEMMSCIGTEIDQQDARLNQAYVMVMRSLSAAKKVALRQSERAWIGQRDVRCRRLIQGDDGTAASLTYSGCILDETIKRTIFLEGYKG